MNSDESVSLHLFPVNRVHHCSADPTARGGPRLVRLNFFFFFFFLKKKKKKKKKIKKKKFFNPFNGCLKPLI